MSSKKIENGRYWNIGWQIIDGCTPCSPGCDNCWSAAMTHRVKPWPYEIAGENSDCHYPLTEHGHFTGQIVTYPERLSVPLKRKQPTVYAIWNDLFHPDVPQSFQEDVFSIIDECRNRHTFLILTKRPAQMAEFLAWDPWVESKWPNVYLGFTVCNQQEADEKIPIFLQVPGKKFLSIEPMLEPIKLNYHWLGDCDCKEHGFIYNIILGGETGAKAKPLHPGWVRSVRNQCAEAGVPFFFKGWGKYGVNWFNDFDNNKIPGSEWMHKGVKKSRELDGREYNEIPWVKK